MLLIKLAIIAVLMLLVIQLLLQFGSSFIIVLPIVIGVWIFLIIQNQKSAEDEELDDF